MLFAAMTAGCATSPQLAKRTNFRVEEIRQEIELLCGTYHYAGQLLPVGGGGITLRPNGTFEYHHPSCTAAVSTFGRWHPIGNRIEFESDFVATGRHDTTPPYSIKWLSTRPARKGDLTDLPCDGSGMQVVSTATSIALYPLAPEIRRQIARGPTVWPLRKDIARRTEATGTKRKR